MLDLAQLSLCNNRPFYMFLQLLGHGPTAAVLIYWDASSRWHDPSNNGAPFVKNTMVLSYNSLCKLYAQAHSKVHEILITSYFWVILIVTATLYSPYKKVSSRSLRLTVIHRFSELDATYILEHCACMQPFKRANYKKNTLYRCKVWVWVQAPFGKVAPANLLTNVQHGCAGDTTKGKKHCTSRNRGCSVQKTNHAQKQPIQQISLKCNHRSGISSTFLWKTLHQAKLPFIC